MCPEAVEVHPSVVRLKVAGKLSCRVFLAPGATVTTAKQQITADIMRSLRTRLGISIIDRYTLHFIYL